MTRRKRYIGFLVVGLLLLSIIAAGVLLNAGGQASEKPFHAVLVNEKESLTVSASDNNELYIICAYKDGKPSELSAVKFIPAEGRVFNGHVQCWMREDGKVEYVVNGDLYTGMSENSKETLVKDTVVEKDLNIEAKPVRDRSEQYLYEHEFL